MIITCEHASRRVPASCRALFAGRPELLTSHRGHDSGSLALARQLAGMLDAPLFTGRWTRLLVDLNRSVGHPRLFSEVTRALPRPEQLGIIEKYYRPYRETVERAVARAIRHARVLHLSVHSFTPIMNNEVRNADIGLLYDPKRPMERRFAQHWKRGLVSELAWRVRCNYPYRGTADGFTTYLRTRFPDPVYAGIELELNQALPPVPRRIVSRIANILVNSMHLADSD